MPILSKTQIENLALAHIRAKPIVTDEESSLEARECRRFYPEAVADMLSGEHSFSFAIQRIVLARLSTNDREYEWPYAYQLPSNLGNAIRVLPDFGGLGLGLPIALPGQPYAETWALTGGYFEMPYVIDGSTLYCNVEDATLEYAIGDVDGVNIPQLVVSALALDLGARLAYPVKQDRERETDLLQRAEVAWQRAIADDQNRHPQQSGQYVSEAMMARRGYLPESA